MSFLSNRNLFSLVATLSFQFGRHLGMLLLLHLHRFYAVRLGQQVSLSSFRERLPTLVVEWEMLNFAAIFLLSSDLALFQLTDVMDDPLTRTGGFLSITFSSFGILYSCVYLVNFSAARIRDSETGEGGNEGVTEGNPELNYFPRFRLANMLADAATTQQCVIWNAGVLLALPAIWTSWSAVCFVFTLLAILWKLSTAAWMSPTALTVRHSAVYAADFGAKYVPFMAVAIVFAVGSIYLFLVIRALRFW